MSNYRGSQRYLSAVVHFHIFIILILDIDVVPDKYLARNPHTSQAVEKRSQGGCSRQIPGKNVADAAKDSSMKRLFFHGCDGC